MKPPLGPFWAWTDIGTGIQWHLCYVTQDSEPPDPPTMFYPLADFTDYWYDDDWQPEEIRPIRKPRLLDLDTGKAPPPDDHESP